MGTDRQQGLKFHNINKQVANCYYYCTFVWPEHFIIAEGLRFQVICPSEQVWALSLSFTNYMLVVGWSARSNATETELCICHKQ